MPEQSAPVKPIIKEIKSIEAFDSRRYRFTFLDNVKRYIASVTTKLEEYREKGVERYRENVGAEEANRALNEGAEMGSLVHHACFLLATGGAVLYEPPAYQTVGIANEEVGELVKQNSLIRQQLLVQKIPFLTINDQYRYLQCAKFKKWLDVVKPEVLYAETVVYDIELDIAGRIDFLFKVKGGSYPIAGSKDVWLPQGIILPDVKSGSWSEKYWLQLGAYRKAVQNSLGLEVEATVGIHLKAMTNSGLNTLVHSAEEADNDFQLYQHVAAIYDAKHKNDNPTDFEFETVLLGTQASGVILGTTMPNKMSDEKLEKGLLAQSALIAGAKPENGSGDTNTGTATDSTVQQELMPETKDNQPKTTPVEAYSGSEKLHKRGRR